MGKRFDFASLARLELAAIVHFEGIIDVDQHGSGSTPIEILLKIVIMFSCTIVAI